MSFASGINRATGHLQSAGETSSRQSLTDLPVKWIDRVLWLVCLNLQQRSGNLTAIRRAALLCLFSRQDEFAGLGSACRSASRTFRRQ